MLVANCKAGDSVLNQCTSIWFDRIKKIQFKFNSIDRAAESKKCNVVIEYWSAVCIDSTLIVE